MSESEQITVYQLKIFILGISPMIWRRFKVHSNSTIADLHYIVQIVMGWTDSHLHRFIIHGKDYGIAQIGGISFDLENINSRLKQYATGDLDSILFEQGIG
jgi:Plasmid pRiA4b ORF-3-like protein